MISQSLYRMISLCTEYHKKTLGCFDVTIHSDNYNQDTIHSIHLYPEAQSVFFQQAGTTINLSGFLKGYALDKIREILKVHIIANALINMGNSSVLALGKDGKSALTIRQVLQKTIKLNPYSLITNV